MINFKEYIKESIHKNAEVVSDKAGNKAEQSLYKGLTIATDSQKEGHYKSYKVHAHKNPNNEYVSTNKSDAHITHYTYPKNKKPSYVSDDKHKNIIEKGRFIVREPDHYGIYDRSTEHYHKTASSALKHAAEIAKKTYKSKMNAALGAAQTYSHRHFRQIGM